MRLGVFVQNTLPFIQGEYPPVPPMDVSINGLINKWTTMRNNLDEMCKLDRAYCDQPDHKLEPEDLTSSTLGLSTPE